MAEVGSARSGAGKRKQAEPVTKRPRPVVAAAKPTANTRVRGVSGPGPESVRRMKPLSANELNQLRVLYAAKKEAEQGVKMMTTGFIVSVHGPGGHGRDKPHIMISMTDERDIIEQLDAVRVKEEVDSLPVKKFGEGDHAVNFLKISIGEMLKSGEGAQMLKLIGVDVNPTTNNHNLTSFPVDINGYIRKWGMNGKSGVWVSAKTIIPQVSTITPRKPNKRNVVPAPPVPAPMEEPESQLADFPMDEMYNTQELELATEYDLEGMPDIAEGEEYED